MTDRRKTALILGIDLIIYVQPTGDESFLASIPLFQNLGFEREFNSLSDGVDSRYHRQQSPMFYTQ